MRREGDSRRGILATRLSRLRLERARLVRALQKRLRLRLAPLIRRARAASPPPLAAPRVEYATVAEKTNLRSLRSVAFGVVKLVGVVYAAEDAPAVWRREPPVVADASAARVRRSEKRSSLLGAFFVLRRRLSARRSSLRLLREPAHVPQKLAPGLARLPSRVPRRERQKRLLHLPLLAARLFPRRARRAVPPVAVLGEIKRRERAHRAHSAGGRSELPRELHDLRRSRGKGAP
mmetsp:Transcript_4306/g.18309  ORF Transcript_4306/g.18309 Transcript_4306/m.18309 type:complete len:234 (+) Transcript_4306:1740-2441(+)